MLTKRQVRAAIGAETGTCHICSNLDRTIGEVHLLKHELEALLRTNYGSIRTQHAHVNAWIQILVDEESDLFDQALEHLLSNSAHDGSDESSD